MFAVGGLARVGIHGVGCRLTRLAILVEAVVAVLARRLVNPIEQRLAAAALLLCCSTKECGVDSRRVCSWTKYLGHHARLLFQHLQQLHLLLWVHVHHSVLCHGRRVHACHASTSSVRHTTRSVAHVSRSSRRNISMPVDPPSACSPAYPV